MSNSNCQSSSLGRAIRAARNRKAMSRNRLAEKSGVTSATLRGIETGRTKQPRFQTVEMIADALKIKPEILLANAHCLDDDASPNPIIGLSNSSVSYQTHDIDGLILTSHWSELLRVLTNTQNTIGLHDLDQIVRTQLMIIIHRRKQAEGEERCAAMIAEAKWSEFASWVSASNGKYEESQQWLERSISLAQRAEHKPLMAYSLMRSAQQAAEYGDGLTTTLLAQEAISVPGISNRDLALCKVREAQGYALSGDRAACKASIDEACRMIDSIDALHSDSDPRTIGFHCNSAYVRAYMGCCQLLLGDVRPAITTLNEAIGHWPSTFRHDEGLARAWLAIAYAADRQIDSAVSHGKSALSIASDIGSKRILHALTKIDAYLAKQPSSTAEVAEFRIAYAAAQRYRLR